MQVYEANNILQQLKIYCRAENNPHILFKRWELGIDSPDIMNLAFLRRREKILFYLKILQKMLLSVFLFYFQISNKSDEACLLTYSTSSHFLTQKGRVFSKKSRSPNFSSQLTARRQRCELLWIEFFFRYEKISSKLSQHFSTVWFFKAAVVVAMFDQTTPTVKSYVRC